MCCNICVTQSSTISLLIKSLGNLSAPHCKVQLLYPVFCCLDHLMYKGFLIFWQGGVKYLHYNSEIKQMRGALT